MRGDAACRLFEDQQDVDAAHYGQHGSVEPPMQPVQALQLRQKVACVWLWRGLPKSDERILRGYRSHEEPPTLSLMAALARWSRTETLPSLIPSAIAMSFTGISSRWRVATALRLSGRPRTASTRRFSFTACAIASSVGSDGSGIVS